MKILTNTKMAKISLILGGISFAMLISSCAMSPQKSGERGAGVGAVTGAAVGAIATKNRGGSKKQIVENAIGGAIGGGAIGGGIGENTSKLPDLGGVILDNL